MRYKKMTSIAIVGAMLFMTSCSTFDSLKNELTNGKSVTTQFKQAIDYYNIEWLNEIIEANPKLDINNIDVGSSLAYALFNGGGTQTQKNNLSRALLDAGADPNIISSIGEPVLMTAAGNERLDATKILLEYGADVNVKNGFGNTPLYCAMSNSSGGYEYILFQQVQMLVEAGAKPYPEMFQNERPEDDEAGVVYMQVQDSPLSVRYLLNILLESGQESGLPKAVEYAFLGKPEKVVEVIESGEKLAIADKHIICMYMTYFGTPETLQRVQNIFGYEKTYVSSMRKTGACGNLEMVKYLSEELNIPLSGEDVSDFTKDTLVYAALMRENEVCKYLCENNIELQGDILPLRMAAMGGDLECFKTIYEYIKSKNGKIDEINLSTISYINLSEKTQIINYLMKDNGHDFRYVSIDGLDYDTIKLLYDNGRPINITDLEYAIKSNDLKIVQLVLDNGAIASQGYYSNEADNDEYIEFAEKHGFNGNETYKSFVTTDEENKTTSLWMAVREGTSEIVELLVENNANVNTYCVSISYPLQRAVHSSKATTKVLLEAGAKTDIIGGIYKGHEDYDLTKLYKEFGRDDLIKLLKEYDDK